MRVNTFLRRIDMIMFFSLALSSSKNLASANGRGRVVQKFATAAFASPQPPSDESSTKETPEEPVEFIPPWNHPSLIERAQGHNGFRSRQHVNPLSRQFQQQTILSPDWPRDMFNDLSRPLFLDIGCSRGGFLLDLVKARPDDYNYLGLEIRPIVVYHAQQRVETHSLQGRLGFVGCNANVDLKRLLDRADAQGNLKMVAIQFPDPHFKAQHAKRRVVTSKLVSTLAEFMPTDATVFLQSDVQSVLDGMREQFREVPELFQDEREALDDYVEENIIGIPTERETSVIEKGLPVYRAVFKRTSLPVSSE
jgi:tRNA (guanine-N7-)-methyltransferase